MPTQTLLRPIPAARLLALATVPTLAALAWLPACGTAAPAERTFLEPRGSAGLDTDGFAKLGYRLEWTGFATVSPGEQLARVMPLGDTILAQDSGSLVTALSPASGEARWTTTLASPLTRFFGAVRDEKRLLVCAESEIFFLDEEAGTLLTKQRLARVINTAPVKVGPMLVFGTSSGEVLGHLTTNGIRAWSYKLAGGIDADPVAMAEETVAVASQAGDVIIVRAADGTATARTRIFDGPGNALAASASRVFIAGRDQSVWAFDLYGREPAWRKRTASVLTAKPVFHEGRVYLTIPDEGFVALDAGTGATVWAAKNVRGELLTVAKGQLLVWDGTEAVTLDPASGDVRQRVFLPSFQSLTAESLVDGRLLAARSDGTIHALRVR